MVLKNLIYICLLFLLGCNPSPIAPIGSEAPLDFQYQECGSPNWCEQSGINLNGMNLEHQLELDFESNWLNEHNTYFNYDPNSDLVYSNFSNDSVNLSIQISLRGEPRLRDKFFAVTNGEKIHYKIGVVGELPQSVISTFEGVTNEVEDNGGTLTIDNPIFLDSIYRESNEDTNYPEPHWEIQYEANLNYSGILYGLDGDNNLMVKFERNFLFIFKESL